MHRDADVKSRAHDPPELPEYSDNCDSALLHRDQTEQQKEQEHPAGDQ
jgi:hypothetical protein